MLKIGSPTAYWDTTAKDILAVGREIKGEFSAPILVYCLENDGRLPKDAQHAFSEFSRGTSIIMEERNTRARINNPLYLIFKMAAKTYTWVNNVIPALVDVLSSLIFRVLPIVGVLLAPGHFCILEETVMSREGLQGISIAPYLMAHITQSLFLGYFTHWSIGVAHFVTTACATFFTIRSGFGDCDLRVGDGWLERLRNHEFPVLEGCYKART